MTNWSVTPLNSHLSALGVQRLVERDNHLETYNAVNASYKGFQRVIIMQRTMLTVAWNLSISILTQSRLSELQKVNTHRLFNPRLSASTSMQPGLSALEKGNTHTLFNSIPVSFYFYTIRILSIAESQYSQPIYFISVSFYLYATREGQYSQTI